MDMNTLFISLVAGCIGMGYLAFGKKSGKLVPIGAGLGLMVVPYFLSGLGSLLAVSTVLTVAPFVVKE